MTTDTFLLNEGPHLRRLDALFDYRGGPSGPPYHRAALPAAPDDHCDEVRETADPETGPPGHA